MLHPNFTNFHLHTTLVCSQRAILALAWEHNHQHLSGVVYESSRRDDSDSAWDFYAQNDKLSHMQILSSMVQNIPKWRVGKMRTGKARWDRESPQTLGETCSGILLATILTPVNILYVYYCDFQGTIILHTLTWIYLLDPIPKTELYYESSLKSHSQCQINHLNIFSIFKSNVLCHMPYWQWL